MVMPSRILPLLFRVAPARGTAISVTFVTAGCWLINEVKARAELVLAQWQDQTEVTSGRWGHWRAGATQSGCSQPKSHGNSTD
jgi:hypothetical protein